MPPLASPLLEMRLLMPLLLPMLLVVPPLRGWSPVLPFDRVPLLAGRVVPLLPGTQVGAPLLANWELKALSVGLLLRGAGLNSGVLPSMTISGDTPVSLPLPTGCVAPPCSSVSSWRFLACRRYSWGWLATEPSMCGFSSCRVAAASLFLWRCITSRT
jgi:hypothetical protein